MTETSPPVSGDKQARRRGLAILAVAVAAGALLWGGWWQFYARYFETTNDAYVAGDVIMVTSREAGTVLALHADNTENVRRGQLLVELDPARAEVQFEAAKADLAHTVRNVQAGFAKVAELQALYANASTRAQQADADLQRRLEPAKDGAISAEEAAHVRDAAVIAHAQEEAAKNVLAQAESAVSGTTTANNPAVLAAIARLKSAAPAAGAVAQRTVQIGQHVGPGTPLMAIIPLEHVWVDANFKETQLADIRVGQPVTITADLYGGSVDYHGVVAGLGAGSGNTFALLPPQNASGNWIKIVQRVPVRIALDPEEVRANPLRLGLSVTVSVDHHDTSGSLLGSTVRPMNATGVADTADKDAGKLVAKILKENTIAGVPQ